MSEHGFQQAEMADLLGVIERLAGELSLAEEPARFVAALEDGAPRAGGPSAAGSAPAR
ncbi:MAG TPA: hypothetical protein VFE48_20950 [Methylomirabilota bacterium]|nr:hypothetical protein [Methylomirabilota bacterium]